MYVHFFAYIYLIILDSKIREVLAFITVLDHGIFPLHRGSVGIQFFIDIENSHHQGICRVSSWPKMCCLTDEDYNDCSGNYIHDDIVELVMPKNRETLIHVFPTLYQYDQVGYCDFVIEFKCGNARRSRQVPVHIPFDTQIANKKKFDYLKAYTDLKGTNCGSLDEDSLRECEPVNCDLKYSGRRPFYEGSHSKCVSAPVCYTDVRKDLPDIVYVPESNICRDLDHSITLGDIYAINTGLGIVTESTKPASNDFTILLESNCSTISENAKMLQDMMFGKLCPLFNGDTSGYKKCCENAFLSIFCYIIAISGLLLSIACCLQTTMWCYDKWTKGELKQTFMNWIQGKAKPSESRDVVDSLLKEVIVRDLPIEMRESVVDICQRIHQEIKQKKRYRMNDLGSQVSLRESESSSFSETSCQASISSMSDDDDRAKLMK